LVLVVLFILRLCIVLSQAPTCMHASIPCSYHTGYSIHETSLLSAHMLGVHMDCITVSLAVDAQPTRYPENSTNITFMAERVSVTASAPAMVAAARYLKTAASTPRAVTSWLVHMVPAIEDEPTSCSTAAN